jgi:hypothetical protein
MNEQASKITIDLVKEFVDLLNSADPQWTKGYYRFLYEPGHYGCNGSYTNEEDTLLIGALKYSTFFEAMTQISLKIFEAIEKPMGLLLLIVDSDLNYDIKFEWHDLGRWRITKLDGATGIPTGL